MAQRGEVIGEIKSEISVHFGGAEMGLSASKQIIATGPRTWHVMMSKIVAVQGNRGGKEVGWCKFRDVAE
jgi:hypothetical protein